MFLHTPTTKRGCLGRLTPGHLLHEDLDEAILADGAQVLHDVLVLQVLVQGDLLVQRLGVPERADTTQTTSIGLLALRNVNGSPARLARRSGHTDPRICDFTDDHVGVFMRGVYRGVTERYSAGVVTRSDRTDRTPTPA